VETNRTKGESPMPMVGLFQEGILQPSNVIGALKVIGAVVLWYCGYSSAVEVGFKRGKRRASQRTQIKGRSRSSSVRNSSTLR